MRFVFTGVDRDRKRVSGSLEAQDLFEAKLRLRAMKIRPIDLDQSDSRRPKAKHSILNMTIGRVIDIKGMSIFTRQFSSLIDAGVPVVQGLGVLFAQERRPAFKEILGLIKADLEAGNTLAMAMAKHPKVFDEFTVRLVEAGEVSGTIDRSLQRIGIHLEKTERLRVKVKKAMTYPLLTIFMAIVILIFLLVKVIPSVSQLYAESNAKLPELTQSVLALSDWVQHTYPQIIATVIGMVAAIIFIQRVPGFRAVWDPFVLRIPLFGNLIRQTSISRFSRTMSTLVASGVPLLVAFEICARIVTNLAVRAIINRAIVAVSEGKSISSALASSPIFPSMVVHMVSVGEMTGKLDELLTKVADIYETEVDDSVDTITSLIQPALIIVVGGMILFLLVAMYLPIFQLAERTTGGM